jgi:uncharacterized protein YkwD
VNRKSCCLAVLIFMLLLTACGANSNTPGQSSHSTSMQVQSHQQEQSDQQGQSNQQVTTSMEVPTHTVLPTPTPHVANPTATALPRATATPLPTATAESVNIPRTASGPAPYGQPPLLTGEEQQLTQQLFALINSDRAAHGLYPFTWNPTLASGARLHSWNMYHCGFSHTCPDGSPQCQRIANEGFAGYSDCGENIAYAGPFPTAWEGTQKIQEGMAHEGPTGWHYIHLFSTTLHRIGVGVYVDPGGYIWFTEDMVS